MLRRMNGDRFSATPRRSRSSITVSSWSLHCGGTRSSRCARYDSNDEPPSCRARHARPFSTLTSESEARWSSDRCDEAVRANQSTTNATGTTGVPFTAWSASCGYVTRLTLCDVVDTAASVGASADPFTFVEIGVCAVACAGSPADGAPETRRVPQRFAEQQPSGLGPRRRWDPSRSRTRCRALQCLHAVRRCLCSDVQQAATPPCEQDCGDLCVFADDGCVLGANELFLIGDAEFGAAGSRASGPFGIGELLYVQAAGDNGAG